MKILLVSDIPPCHNYTAGLVLDQLCRFMKPGSIAGFFIVNSSLTDARLTPDLDWIPVKYEDKPAESWTTSHLQGRWLLQCASFRGEMNNRRYVLPPLIDRIASFGREFGANALWIVLQGQTEIQIATPLARRLRVPLLSQMWDPPYFWMDAHKVNYFHKTYFLELYARTIRRSTRVFAASWYMADKYREDYGADAIPFLPSLDIRLAKASAARPHDRDVFIIGGAGKLYPVETWQALLDALDTVNWRINGRVVRLRLLSQSNVFSNRPEGQIEFLGWRGQAEAVALLAEADLLYCPYWFDPYFEWVARLSFPGKMTTYLAAGRPVMFHGPSYSSPARFLDGNKAGMVCDSLDPGVIASALNRIAKDESLYAQLARNGRRAFDRHLTTSSMREHFSRFLGVDDAFLASDGA